MAELAQRPDGLGRHRHGADGPGAFGDAVAVISTKPIRTGSTGALWDAHVTDQTSKECGAEFGNGQAITQRLNKVVGQMISGDQVAACSGCACDIGPLFQPESGTKNP